jgi:hypothetical protein
MVKVIFMPEACSTGDKKKKEGYFPISGATSGNLNSTVYHLFAKSTTTSLSANTFSGCQHH